jgi:hypothetical protein
MRKLLLYYLRFYKGSSLLHNININLHGPRDQPSGIGCVAQLTLCVEVSYCLPVPTNVPQSWRAQCGRFPAKFFRDITQFQGISVLSSPWNCDTTPIHDNY